MNNMTYEQLQECLRESIKMLAKWCVAVDKNGTSWDDWDEHYKNASYRDTNPEILRKLIDDQIEKEKDDKWKLSN